MVGGRRFITMKVVRRNVDFRVCNSSESYKQAKYEEMVWFAYCCWLRPSLTRLQRLSLTWLLWPSDQATKWPFVIADLVTQNPTLNLILNQTLNRTLNFNSNTDPKSNTDPNPKSNTDPNPINLVALTLIPTRTLSLTLTFTLLRWGFILEDSIPLLWWRHLFIFFCWKDLACIS